MKNVYLINDIIIFNPQAYTLTPRKSWPSGRITLHAPAAECLHLLLTHAGQPVSQKLIFAEVWEKRGVVVSTNTLYQSIASIRKGLKAAGLEDDIVRTLPKQGFQCNASVQYGPVDEFVIPASRTEKNITEPATEKIAETAPDTASYSTLRHGWILSLFLSVMMIAALIYWKKEADVPLAIQYYPAGQIENCTLFSSWSGADYSQAIFSELKQRYPINCGKKKTAYLTINRLQIGSTLILCDSPIENTGTQCQSIMFRDNNDENN